MLVCLALSLQACGAFHSLPAISRRSSTSVNSHNAGRPATPKRQSRMAISQSRDDVEAQISQSNATSANFVFDEASLASEFANLNSMPPFELSSGLVEREYHFSPMYDEVAGLKEASKAKYDSLRKDAQGRLAESYNQCKYITSIYAKTFYFGTLFMDRPTAESIWAVYAWCRRTDDIVDMPRRGKDVAEQLRIELDEWEARLANVWEGVSFDQLDLALVDTVRRHPDLSIHPFSDMIKGMCMDLDVNRYATFDDLYLYCYRVAGTVGLMTMPIMGTAPGVSYNEATGPALALGVALQLTNIIRDVGEDARRGRIYLPQEDLVRFGVPEKHILDGVVDENYKNLLKFQIARARYYFKLAERGIPMLAPAARLPVRSSLDLYRKILERVEANDYDNFRKRAYVSKVEKFMALPLSWINSMAPAAPTQEAADASASA